MASVDNEQLGGLAGAVDRARLAPVRAGPIPGEDRVNAAIPSRVSTSHRTAPEAGLEQDRRCPAAAIEVDVRPSTSTHRPRDRTAGTFGITGWPPSREPGIESAGAKHTMVTPTSEPASTRPCDDHGTATAAAAQAAIRRSMRGSADDPDRGHQHVQAERHAARRKAMGIADRERGEIRPLRSFPRRRRASAPVRHGSQRFTRKP